MSGLRKDQQVSVSPQQRRSRRHFSRSSCTSHTSSADILTDTNYEAMLAAELEEGSRQVTTTTPKSFLNKTKDLKKLVFRTLVVNKENNYVQKMTATVHARLRYDI